MVDELRIGATVHGANDKKIGTLKRIVLERDGARVTHLVVDPGLIESGNFFAPGGWEKPRERLAPIALVSATGERGVTLTCDEAAFLALPLFEQETFEEAPPGGRPFDSGELLRYIASAAGVGAAPFTPDDEELDYNEAPGSIEIAEGSPVWRAIPHEEIGEVVRVLYDDASDTVRALVVRHRGLGGRSVIIPMDNVATLTDGVVHVNLTDEEVAALPPYE
jgi:sporulation protein YlmC with PRC-barrel domain